MKIMHKTYQESLLLNVRAYLRWKRDLSYLGLYCALLLKVWESVGNDGEGGGSATSATLACIACVLLLKVWESVGCMGRCESCWMVTAACTCFQRFYH